MTSRLQCLSAWWSERFHRSLLRARLSFCSGKKTSGKEVSGVQAASTCRWLVNKTNPTMSNMLPALHRFAAAGAGHDQRGLKTADHIYAFLNPSIEN